MIISKTPYRIPLTGGGTDLDFYFKKKGGELFSVAINQYVYVHLQERKIESNYLIQATDSEFANNIKDLKHILIRETLKFFKITEKMHIGTYTTIPTKTGLGTSSAMIVGLINCIKKFKNLHLSNLEIIKKAYEIERNVCKLYGGWQDQIISQYGGLVKIKIDKKSKLNIKKIKISSKIKKTIHNHLLLVYTKIKRESSKVVLSQKKREEKIIRYYDKIKNLNKFLINALQSKNSEVLADIFKEHWEYKKKLSNQMTSKSINILFEKLIRKYNFSGGKLVGAGGGGFFLMVTKNKKSVIKRLKKDRIGFIDFKVENIGSRIIES
jgi:D-glycero-alpha-D-manno-heptose-7-phosphate kinase|tara:strand:+ start:800 stop:1771 length:972 start_codon:yes stop_codon:yes gene_type:complete